jgi:hypothetical protein
MPRYSQKETPPKQNASFKFIAIVRDDVDIFADDSKIVLRSAKSAPCCFSFAETSVMNVSLPPADSGDSVGRSSSESKAMMGQSSLSPSEANLERTYSHQMLGLTVCFEIRQDVK